MRSHIACLTFLLAMGVSAHAQAVDPADILQKADSACRLVRTATYTASLLRGSLNDELRRVDGAVSMRRIEGDDPVGAAVQLTCSDGTGFAYDGNTVRMLAPKMGKMVIGSRMAGATKMLTGNEVGTMVQIPMMESGGFSKLIGDDRELTWEGIRDVEHVPCHVVAVAAPDNEYFKSIRTTWFIGAFDYLPRMRISAYSFNGEMSVDTLLLSNLEVNVDLPDSTFETPVAANAPHGHVESSELPQLLPVGAPAPDWSLPDSAGKRVSLRSMRGKLVVLDFWYTTCGPCLKAMPDIQQLHEKYRDRGVLVFGVDSHERRPQDAVKLMRRRGFTYGLLLQGDDVATAYHVYGFPTVYIIGGDGTIVYRIAGYGKEQHEEFTRVIEEYLSTHGP